MSHSTDDLVEELAHLRNRVDAVDEKAGGVIWYKNPATVISLLAFVVSFGTTIISYRHTSQQDIHNLRTELRGILQRMTALPKENAELAIQFKDDSNSQMSLSGLINQENMILTQQAEDAIKRLPLNEVSAIDYITVGQALQNAQNYDAAIDAFTKASENANGLADAVGSLRMLANLQMLIGLEGKSRENYQAAIDVVSKYRLDEFARSTYLLQTQLYWAIAEMNGRHYSDAQRHVDEASALGDRLPPGLAANTWKMQINQVRQYVSKPVQANGATLNAGGAPQIGAPQTIR